MTYINVLLIIIRHYCSFSNSHFCFIVTIQLCYKNLADSIALHYTTAYPDPLFFLCQILKAIDEVVVIVCTVESES